MLEGNELAALVNQLTAEGQDELTIIEQSGYEDPLGSAGRAGLLRGQPLPPLPGVGSLSDPFPCPMGPPASPPWRWASAG